MLAGAQPLLMGWIHLGTPGHVDSVVPAQRIRGRSASSRPFGSATGKHR